MKISTWLLTAFGVLALLGGLTAGGSMGDGYTGHGGFPGTAGFRPGFVVHADARFDPFIQRLMAERSLKALPLRDGQLFYIVPVDTDPRLEEMQIRYLEHLLDKAGARDAFEPSGNGP